MWWNRYIGLPFAERGRDSNGVDCWGLVRLIYEHERGIILPSYSECYQSTNDREELSRIVDSERQQNWQETNQPQELDVIILNMRGVPMHVGLVTKPGFMIHSARGINTVHESYTGLRWRDKVIGFSRWVK